jgi:hypothetical protein
MSAQMKLLLKCNEHNCGGSYEGPWGTGGDVMAEHSAWKSGWLRLGRYAEDRHRCPNCVSRIAAETYAAKLRKGERGRVEGIG